MLDLKLGPTVDAQHFVTFINMCVILTFVHLHVVACMCAMLDVFV